MEEMHPRRSQSPERSHPPHSSSKSTLAPYWPRTSNTAPFPLTPCATQADKPSQKFRRAIPPALYRNHLVSVQAKHPQPTNPSSNSSPSTLSTFPKSPHSHISLFPWSHSLFLKNVRRSFPPHPCTQVPATPGDDWSTELPSALYATASVIPSACSFPRFFVGRKGGSCLVGKAGVFSAWSEMCGAHVADRMGILVENAPSQGL